MAGAGSEVWPAEKLLPALLARSCMRSRVGRTPKQLKARSASVSKMAAGDVDGSDEDDGGDAYDAKAMQAGARPPWHSASFLDLFADGYISGQEGVAAAARQPGVGPIALSIEYMSALLLDLQRVERDGDAERGGLDAGVELGALTAGAVGDVQRALHAALPLFTQLPVAAADDQRFEQFLQALTGRLKLMQPGDVLLLPGGWATTPADVHVCAYLLQRDEHDSQKCRFAIVNTGAGAELHPSRVDLGAGAAAAALGGGGGNASASAMAAAEGAGAGHGKIKRMLSLVLESVPYDRIKDASFWFMIYRLLVYVT